MFQELHSFGLGPEIPYSDLEIRISIASVCFHTMVKTFKTLQSSLRFASCALLVIKEYARREENENIENYVEGISKDYAVSMSKYWSGNQVIDFVLNQKISKAEKKGIEVTVKTGPIGNIPLSESEICALFGNLLDNAIEATAKIENLDSLPWVSKVYHKHLYSCYKRYFYGANLNPLIVILSGRGCPNRCSYCVIPQTINGHVFRKRSPKDVVDELEFILNNFEDLGEVFFEDDTFTADPKHVRAICELILERKLKITWSCNARADVPLDLLQLMKKAGAREMCVGFESASPEVLKNIRKGVKNTDKAIEFVKNARKANLLVHGCFMVGNPGDTPETLRMTLDYAKKLSPNTAQFYPIMAYPGTEAYKEALESGALQTKDYNQWLDKDGFHRTTIQRGELSSQDLVDFCDKARREFYLRPSYILRQGIMSIKNPRERYRVLRGFKTLVKHLFRKHGSLAPVARQAPTNKA